MTAASVAAAATIVGAQTNAAGVMLLLLWAATLYIRDLSQLAGAQARWPASKLVRSGIKLAGMAFLLGGSVGLAILGHFDFSWVPKAVWTSLALGVAGAAVLWRFPQRWQSAQLPVWRAMTVALLAAVAIEICYASPLSADVVAAQRWDLGQIALRAFNTGDLAQLRRNTLPGYDQNVSGELLYDRAFNAFRPFTVVGQPVFRKDEAQYRLSPHGASGELRLTVEFAERHRKEMIWNLVMTGTATRTTILHP